MSAEGYPVETSISGNLRPTISKSTALDLETAWAQRGGHEDEMHRGDGWGYCNGLRGNQRGAEKKGRLKRNDQKLEPGAGQRH